MSPGKRRLAWFLLVALLLLAAFLLLLGLLRKLERDQLFLLEQNMLQTAQALVPGLQEVLAESNPGGVAAVQERLETTQNVTGSRIRVLSQKRNLLYDSLSPKPEPQEQLRFRPEIQEAFVGRYGAYTRFSDETPNSLSLFVAWPVKKENRVVGCVYVSHGTDEILQQLGTIRRAANRAIVALSLVALLGSLLLTGELRTTLARLRTLTSGVDTVESRDIDLEGSDQVARIGQNFNRLVANLRHKVAELEEERTKTHRFLEDVAHELKTPITGLAGSVEALESEQTKEQDRTRLLSNVRRETERLSQLTSRLLELQALEYQTLKVQPFDLTSVAETVVDSLESAARKGDIDLVLTREEALVVHADSDKVQRVIENLVDNAIRCSPKRESVILQLEDSDVGTVVSILDRGPGPPEPEAFQRHRQGTRFKGSLGLGLSIASEIVEMHGSALEALPREGGGSEFRFSLPSKGEPQ